MISSSSTISMHAEGW